MNDPHVVALHYRVDAPERVTYDNPSPVPMTTGEFDLVVHEGVAVATLHVHCATAEEARRLIEPVLDAWEIDAALNNGGVPLLRFAFDSADIIDRNPPPAGSPVVVDAVAVACGSSVASAATSVTLSRYPPAPTMRVTADVQTLWFRYSLWKDGHDSLASVAYFCLTYVEVLGGRRAGAAQKFAIATAVLSTLGRLSSAVGDGMSARKWTASAERRSHTPDEVRWIDAAIRAIIRRVGEHAAGITPLPTLAMADLPPLV